MYDPLYDGRIAGVNADQVLSNINAFGNQRKPPHNPPPQVPKKNDWDDTLDNVQNMADFAGFIPGVGDVVDLGNAAVSLARGDLAGAAMRGVSAIPLVGDVIGKGWNWGGKVLKGLKGVG